MVAQSVFLGIVKQVISGDTLVLRDRPVDGPPPERTIVLSNISCGRIARRPTVQNPNSVSEDPFAWEAREFLRGKLVGKEVCYIVERELPSGRKCGSVFNGKTTSCENVAVSLLKEGLAELRKLNAVAAEKNPMYQQLMAAEESARMNARGRWSTEVSNACREVIWSLEEPRDLVEKYKNKRLHGVVEYVRDGSTMQITLMPDTLDRPGIYYNIMLSLSGLKAPAVRYEDGRQVAEPYGLEAQFLVESRLLQRDVMVFLESVTNQNFIGTVIHPNGNIAEVLLREGLARCVEWNLSLVSIPDAAAAYRAAEQSAKERRLRLWIDYQPSQNVVTEVQSNDTTCVSAGSSYFGHISEVGNGDNVTVKCSDGVYRKFFLSSVRAPRPLNQATNGETGTPEARTRIRPLYDIPFLFEAREHLRSFVGKPVTVYVDYIQPRLAPTMDERICATIKCGSVNLAQSLVAHGLGSVIRYRNTNDARSTCYSELIAAEEDAQTKALGMHSKEEVPIHRVADLTGNLTKSRQFLPFLRRSPRTEGIIEFVVHASRVRVYLPRESCLTTLLLAGIQCPRRGRPKPDGTQEPDMPFSVEGYNFTKDLCMHRTVEISVDTIDRVGNFVGWCFVDAPDKNIKQQTSDSQKSSKKKKKKAGDGVSAQSKANLSVLLVLHGYATVHRAASTENSPYYRELIEAEETAKQSKCGVWSSEDFIKQWEADAYGAVECSTTETEVLLPGGVTASYIDDLSLLNLNDVETNHGTIKCDWKPAQITSLSKPAGRESLRFFAQHLSDSSTIIQISHWLNAQPLPVVPGYQPGKNDLCAAMFSADHYWYRARVVRRNAKSITVHFIDFGNEESIDLTEIATRTAPLPLGPMQNIPPQAHEFRLAFVQLPHQTADRDVAERMFADTVMNKEVLLATQFDNISCALEELKPVPAVAVKLPPGNASSAGSSAYSKQNEGIDVAHLLLSEGLVCVEPMTALLIKQLSGTNVGGYLAAQATAKKERKNIWCYGDFRVDSAQP